MHDGLRIKRPGFLASSAVAMHAGHTFSPSLRMRGKMRSREQEIGLRAIKSSSTVRAIVDLREISRNDMTIIRLKILKLKHNSIIGNFSWAK